MNNNIIRLASYDFIYHLHGYNPPKIDRLLCLHLSSSNTPLDIMQDSSTPSATQRQERSLGKIDAIISLMLENGQFYPTSPSQKRLHKLTQDP